MLFSTMLMILFVCCRELGRLKEDDLRADEFGFSKPQAKVVLDAVKARKKKFEKS